MRVSYKPPAFRRRYLTADPPIMILDEPALGLDMEEEQRVNAWLRQLAQQGTPPCHAEHPVMLSVAKHLHSHPDNPFAALRVTRKGHPIQRRALLSTRFYPALQKQPIVRHHCPVKFFFCMAPSLYLPFLPFMIPECFSCALYRLWRHFSKMYCLCWQRFPCRRVASVNIGTIAALVRTTIPTPDQK